MSKAIRLAPRFAERLGVLLDLETYRRLENMLTLDKECLVGLSQEELEALAESNLAPAEREHLNRLLAQNAENQLSEEETATLDRLLEQVDRLTVLKTRAKYTLAFSKL